jgi:hypothetical protein
LTSVSCHKILLARGTQHSNPYPRLGVHQQTYKKLFGACPSLYQLVQACKVGKFARVKARSKNSHMISENSCRSEGRVIKLILSHSIMHQKAQVALANTPIWVHIAFWWPLLTQMVMMTSTISEQNFTIKFSFTYSNIRNWCERDCNSKMCRTCDYEHLCERFLNFG